VKTFNQIMRHGLRYVERPELQATVLKCQEALYAANHALNVNTDTLGRLSVMNLDGENIIERLDNGDIVWPGTWECEDNVLNELGTCIYDEAADGAHDSCVFCGQPEERK
jgi:hypothetical protein